MAMSGSGQCNVRYRCNNVITTMFLLNVMFVLLMLLASSADGQQNGDISRNSRVKSTLRPSVSANSSLTKQAIKERKTTVVPSQTKQPVPSLAAAHAREDVEGSDQQRNEMLEDDSRQEELDDDAEIVASTPLPTRPPPASVVTPPLSRIPLETIFMVKSDVDESVCIAVRTGIRFTFTYTNSSNGQTQQGVFDLPARNYSSEGNCGVIRQRMSLIFSPDRQVPISSAVDQGTAWNLTFIFARNGTEVFVEHLSLRFTVLTGHLPFPWSVDAQMTAVLKQPGLFKTPDNEHSFICMSDAGYSDFMMLVDNNNAGGLDQSISSPSKDGINSGMKPSDASDGSNLVTSANLTVQLNVIEFYNLQLQAFMKPQSKDGESGSTSVVFSTNVVQCSGDFISIKVPVILGIILLVFTVSVVVVYMVGRLMHGKRIDEKRPSTDYRPVH